MYQAIASAIGVVVAPRVERPGPVSRLQAGSLFALGSSLLLPSGRS